MKQQVNLYQPIFRKEKKVLSALTLLQGWTAIFIGLSAFYAYALWQTKAVEGQLVGFEARRAAVSQRITALAGAHPARTKSLALEQEVERLRVELRAKQRIVAHLGEQDAGNVEGFSGYLEGLARQRLPLTWLNRVALHKGGRELELTGSTLRPEQVPQYLQRLASEPALAGARFQRLEMNRAKDDPGRIDFKLSSGAGEP